MNYVGSEALLTPAQLAEFDAHLQQELHPTAASVRAGSRSASA
jgi:hypothetical protein